MAYAYIIGIVICLVMLIAIGIWFFLRWRKKKKLEQNLTLTNIPEEVLNDFKEAERRLLQCNGTKTPYEILWDIAKERNQKEVIKYGRESNTTNQGAGVGGTSPIDAARDANIQRDRIFEDGRNIPIQSITEPSKGEQELGKPKRKPKQDWESFS